MCFLFVNTSARPSQCPQTNLLQSPQKFVANKPEASEGPSRGRERQTGESSSPWNLASAIWRPSFPATLQRTTPAGCRKCLSHQRRQCCLADDRILSWSARVPSSTARARRRRGCTPATWSSRPPRPGALGARSPGALGARAPCRLALDRSEHAPRQARCTLTASWGASARVPGLRPALQDKLELPGAMGTLPGARLPPDSCPHAALQRSIPGVRAPMMVLTGGARWCVSSCRLASRGSTSTGWKENNTSAEHPWAHPGEEGMSSTYREENKPNALMQAVSGYSQESSTALPTCPSGFIRAGRGVPLGTAMLDPYEKMSSTHLAYMQVISPRPGKEICFPHGCLQAWAAVARFWGTRRASHGVPLAGSHRADGWPCG